MTRLISPRNIAIGGWLFFFLATPSVFAIQESPTATPESVALDRGIQRLISKQTPLKNGDAIAFFGDSITMQGGYIRFIQNALRESTATKELNVRLLQHGLNGGRVPTVLEGKSPWGDLGGTMESLINREKPSAVVIFLGVNDVWHGEKGTSIADFETGLKTMIELANKSGARMVLCTPTVIGEETAENPLNERLNEYAGVIRRLAADREITLCDLHQLFIDELKRVNPGNEHKGHLTYDGVHMNDAGNELLAGAMAAGIADSLASRRSP